MKRFYFPFTALILLLLFTTCKDDDVAPDYPTDGLVSYYSFDNNLDDVQGNSPTALSSGGVAYVSSHRNEGLLFNGTNGYLTINPAPFYQHGAFTIAFWFKLSSQLGGDPLMNCAYLEISRDGTTISNRVFSPNGGGTYAGFTPGIWSHFVGTYDGTYVQSYIDGSLYAKRYHPGVLTGSAGELTIGKYNSAYLGGNLDEMFIYDRVLNQGEISKLYRR